jgi:hypothetical protein
VGQPPSLYGAQSGADHSAELQLPIVGVGADDESSNNVPVYADTRQPSTDDE